MRPLPLDDDAFPGRGSLRPPAASRCSALRAVRSFPRRPPAYVLPRGRGLSKVFPRDAYRHNANARTRLTRSRSRSAPPHSAPPRSAPLRSGAAPLSAAPLGAAPLGAAPLGGAPLGGAPLEVI
jgi:hypothetical protein